MIDELAILAKCSNLKYFDKHAISEENVRAAYAAVTEKLFTETTGNGYGVCSSQVLFAWQPPEEQS